MIIYWHPLHLIGGTLDDLNDRHSTVILIDAHCGHGGAPRGHWTSDTDVAKGLEGVERSWDVILC